MPNDIQKTLQEIAHNEACEKQQNVYKDPETGLYVLTKFFLLQRGFCCNRRCRHCPYEIK